MMGVHEDVLRELYISDIVSTEIEDEMLKDVDDSYFERIENLLQKIKDNQVLVSKEELEDLEKSFNDFYFEYGFVQFKRGLEIGLQLRNRH